MTTQALKALEDLISTVDECAMPSGIWGSGLYNTNEAKLTEVLRRAREAYTGGSGDGVREIARALCREKCAFRGELPCFQMDGPWPNPNCDEPGCRAEAEAVASLSRPAMPEGCRDAVIEECATLLEDRYFEPNYAEAIRALKTPSPDNERDSTEKKECGRMKT